MGYAQVTWLQLRSKLMDRLGDGVFYSDSGNYPEVSLYLREALRVWNCASLYWRDRFTFPTTAQTAWYDLNSQPMLTKTMKDRDLIAEIQLQTLEPVSPTLWTGTDMFTLAQVTQALERRRDQFLLETAVELDHQQPALAPGTDGRFELPDNVIDVRRLEFIDGAGIHSLLWRSDEWSADAFRVGWNFSQETPQAYSLITTPPLRIQLIPPLNTVGKIDLLSVRRGTPLAPATGIVLGIADDFSWVIKYGALADLLGAEGQARDVPRATYCEQRYRQGVELARLFPLVLEAEINGQDVPVVTLEEADTQQPNWMNTTGVSQVLAVTHHWVVPLPVPNAIFSLMLDVVKPAPIPILDTDFLQLGPEQLEAILDYAQHIAAFKQGGAEFTATEPKLMNLLRLASVHNQRLNSSAIFKRYLEDRSTKQDKEREYRREEVYAE